MDDFEKTITLVLKHYDLGELKEFEFVKGGYANNNFKVFTDKGIYFLRGFKYVNDIKKINALNIFLNDLKDEGFPVPRPYLSKKNEYFVSLDSKVYAIYEFVEGTPYNFSNVQLIESAKTLARFHKAVEDIEVEDYKLLSFEPSFFKDIYVDENYLLTELLKTDFEDKKFLADALKVYDYNVSLLERDFDKLPQRDNYEIVHGDFWFGQLIFKDDKVVALVDFDVIKKSSFEFDLAKGIRSFTRFKDEPGYNFIKIRTFLEEYKKIQPKIKLSKVEIIFYLRYALLSILKFHIFSAVKESFSDVRKHAIIYHMGELGWVESDEEKIVKVFFDVFKT